jgi:tetratricopeptide (TPR) repeat protein
MAMLAERPNRESWRKLQANYYLIVQEFDRAVEVYQSLVTPKAEDPASGEDRFRLLDALQLAGRVEEAIKLVDGWLEESPKKSDIRLWKLLLLYWSGQSEAAVSLCQEWYEADPANMQIRQQLVQALLLSEKPAVARRYVLEWLDKDPDNNSLHVMLLGALTGEDKFAEAIELASSGAETDAVRLDYLDQLAEIHQAAKAYDDLVRVRQQIARERKGDNAAMKHLDAWQVGQALIQAGRYNEAAQDFTRRIDEADSAPFKIEWLRLLSHCYLKNKRPRLAEKQLQDVHDLQPTQEGINNDLGYTLADNGVDLKRAEKYIRLAVGERPTEAAYLDSLGWVLYKQGDFKSAVSWLTKAVRGRSIIQAVQSRPFALDRLVQTLDDPVLYDHLGDALWQFGRKDRAVEAWTKAVASFERAIRLHADRNDFEVLEGLRNKLEAVKENKPPPVAPLGEKNAA